MTLSTNALKSVPSTLGNLLIHPSFLKKECFVACFHFLGVLNICIKQEKKTQTKKR